ncbi:Rha family transcriptional regulator [Pseudoalteromonas sp. CNC9-20]|uniref:Rha family transcriptional regulator n=1 Tax=Pseudoalteromonas sp. CNC9-20 TaxID=2917750 RepID=UPI001EF74B15|nr:Rha family transcriptional regulator [Pseudoalteromonas sp. CNC9-20]MCG7571260.1 Rha family transcriptional regulator [Pseudoalteromonas sp. CNC9-20]
MNLKHTMTSREIAELTGKRHDNVVRDVEAMFNALKIEAVDFLDNYVEAMFAALKIEAGDFLDTEAMFTELKIQPSGYLDSYKDSTGRTLKQYRLDRDLTMTLVTKYDTARRYAVVRRWWELEEG